MHIIAYELIYVCGDMCVYIYNIYITIFLSLLKCIYIYIYTYDIFVYISNIITHSGKERRTHSRGTWAAGSLLQKSSGTWLEKLLIGYHKDLCIHNLFGILMRHRI
jgi:hypothetical protein